MYLVITSVSLVCAVLLFKAGGSLAEVTGEEGTVLGFGFKAGGAIAGFIIIFALSFKDFEKLVAKLPQATINRVYVKRAPKNDASSNGKFECKLWLYDTETGKKDTYNLNLDGKMVC